ncbi:MAG: periplasmic sensor hybrid histidine kinase [bacterium]|nr:MAG: periplasmic sensor hybrid histidine kinase [bacterium]KAF0147526.1 MAG: periplasmic sensor hybrid histidine kinase [bacterium]KAF0166013.1 MAG: periplasmic sensor hybrid histidine kinase [bacterium]TXT16809.1 MAG: periplasmic sensor hybrid histidine kinase [bacterium]
MLSPRAFARIPLRLQLLWLVAGTVALSLAVSMLTAVVLDWGLHEDQAARTLETAARSAATAASAAVAFDDDIAAAEALRILATQKEITAAAVYRLDGERLAVHGDASLPPARAGPAAEHGPDFSPLHTTTHLLRPIVFDDSTLGWIYLHADLAEFRARYLEQTALSVLASLCGLGLAVWLGMRLIERITRPVRGLADLAHRVRDDGNYSLRADAAEAGGSANEVAELVAGINAMLAEIEQRNWELGENRRELEQRVAERTSALDQVNVSLLAQKRGAEEANQAKSRFLAAASHDLRQPMHALSLLVSALDDNLREHGEAGDRWTETRRLADLIEASVRNMGNLLNDLLDLSRLDAGVIVPHPVCARVDEILDRLSARFLPLALKKGLRMRFVTGHMEVETDPVLLDRILANLIDNAIRYTDSGGILVGTRRRAGGGARIEVVDSGIGIPGAMLERIFEEYFQLGNPERDRDKGQGLGLSIVKRLADLLGCRISVRSRPGRGTHFSLELPPCATAAPAPARSEHAVEPAALPGRDGLVLLVEDDEVIVQAMRALFAQWGVPLITASGIEEALRALDAAGRAPALVLSDYRLPGGCDGIGVVARLRARYGGDMPAILVTGDTGEEAMRAVAASGLTLLHKPLHPAKLRALLSHVLK